MLKIKIKSKNLNKPSYQNTIKQMSNVKNDIKWKTNKKMMRMIFKTNLYSKGVVVAA